MTPESDQTSDTTSPRPSCYNRPDYESKWRPGCPHWHAGGNALMLEVGYDVGGKTFPWSACAGCKQYTKAIFKE